MTSHNTFAVLAVATGLALGGGAALAQQSGADRPDAAGAGGQGGQAGQQVQPGQPGQPGAGGQDAQSARQADAQRDLSQLMSQIAADPKTAADKLFVLTAALHNESEIQLARQALEKSQNPQVKKMAQQMLQNLEQTHQQVRQTAQAIGLQIPPSLASAAVQEVNIVASLPADQFDRQYTASAQADNAQDLSQYQSEAQIAQDPQVRKFADQQVQGIQQRSQSANDVARGMNMPGEAQPAGATYQKSGDGR